MNNELLQAIGKFLLVMPVNEGHPQRIGRCAIWDTGKCNCQVAEVAAARAAIKKALEVENGE